MTAGISEYTYDANGKKLRARHVDGSSVTTLDYCGSVVYENGALKRILFDGGYIEDGTYYYYLTDHLGNNRVVVDQNGAVQQTNHYYPFGGTFASTGDNVQPYKFGGKELDVKNGLDLYDFGARQYDAGLGRFTQVDPMAEKYYGVSPYAYCDNNPMRFVDPTGKTIQIPPILTFGNANPIIMTGRMNPVMMGSNNPVRVTPRTNNHHVIPRQVKGDPVVKAARQGGFKFEGKENSVPLEQFSKATGQGRHGNHPKYTEQIKQKLVDHLKDNPKLEPKKAVEFLRKEVEGIKTQIENNPGTKINDLELEIVLPQDNTVVKPVEPPVEPIKNVTDYIYL